MSSEVSPQVARAGAALSGPVNAVAPQPVRNVDYTRTRGRVLRRPAPLLVPPPVPWLVLGDHGAGEPACAGQRVSPARLHQAGHQFGHPDARASLASPPRP
jgi:uncharacterized protein